MKKPTKKQALVVNNILSGKYKSKAQAMKAAGYSEHSSDNPKHILSGRKGIESYLETINQTSVNRFKMPLKNKVMEVFLDGLEANKYYEKSGIEYPDHKLRGEFADRFARFFSWIEGSSESKVNKMQQFNFFNAVPEAEQEKFNGRFKGFLKDYYK